MINDSRFDNGKGFDWGKTSEDYAKYRDIYPEEFYARLHQMGLCTEGQRVLDIGTGTGVIPRYMYKYGARFTAADISENQINAAKKLSAEKGMDIQYIVASAEKISFPEKSFDLITACQCYFYFKPEVFAPLAAKVLTDTGKAAFMYMGWLPFEDDTAGKTEELILKYNPDWSGHGDKRHEIFIDDEYLKYFKKCESVVFDVNVPFTRESWNGRIKACRGIGASLDENTVERFEEEHMKMLEENVQEKFDVLHYCAVTVLEKI
ncbi:MAG: class I SAM-dependent methyltransferase [Ruminococcus sp.]|nr:class I SAM-dependent methyltransferase [Ruminococcus sp.]